MILLSVVLYLFRICMCQGALTFSKKPPDIIRHQEGKDAVFLWDFVRTDNLRSTIWRVYNKTKGGFDTLRVEDENGTYVAFQGVPPPAYVGRLERNGTGTLIVKGVTLEDSALFKCTITEKVTLLTTESPVELVVTGRCSVSSFVRPVKTGDSTRINCTAIGVPAENFTWMRVGDVNKKLSNDAMHSIVSIRGSSELTVQNVTEGNDGYYMCDATVNINEPCSDQSYQQLVYLRKGESCNMRPYSSGISKNLTIDCPVSGYPPPVVTWVKNGTELQKGENTKLTLTNLKEEDFGLYTCAATDFQRTVGPCTITVMKEEEPKVVASDGTDKKVAMLSWEPVDGAKVYVVNIRGDGIRTDRILGTKTSLELHYHTLVMSEAGKQPERIVVGVEVAALGEKALVRRMQFQHLTIIKPVE